MALAAGLLAASALGSAAQPLRTESSRAEQEWLAGVHSALDHRDCKLVAARVNDGLEQRHPEAYVMAGALFEQGLCVKADWARAATLYQRAMAVGHRGGFYRLVAGLAERDPPVALWWAQEGDAARLPEGCGTAAEAHRDAEAYAAALRAWPAGQLAACNYVVGVLASLYGEVEYPGNVVGKALEGSVQMHFLPAQGRIEWQARELHLSDHWRSLLPEARAARQEASAVETVQRYLDEIAQRALRRYPVPARLDPAARVVVQLSFEVR